MSVSGEDQKDINVLCGKRTLIDVIQHDKIGEIFFESRRGVLRFDNGTRHFTNTGNFLPQGIV